MGYFSFIGRRDARSSRARVEYIVALGVVTIAGCTDIERVATFEPVTDPAQLFAALTFDHRAINLSTVAPYDTFRLTATPRNALGEAMGGMPAATLKSSDTTRVWVSPDGLLRARRVASGVRIVAELVGPDNIRHADTAWVKVTANPAPPQLTTFSITPASPEEASWPMNVVGGSSVWGDLLKLYAQFIFGSVGIDIGPKLPLRVLDGSGRSISGLEIEYWSLDPENAAVDRRTGEVRTFAPGAARIVARTVAYGTTKVDTAVFNVTLPVVHSIVVGDVNGSQVMEPTEVRIRRGGYVLWANLVERKQVEFVFDAPENVLNVPEFCAAFGEPHCGGGNIRIPGFDPSSSEDLKPWDLVRVRRFPVPGVYEFRNTLTGSTGRVIVADDGTSE